MGAGGEADDSRVLIPQPKRSSVSALLFSTVIHVILVVAIGLLASRASSGTGEAIDRPVGIAMVHRLPDRDKYTDTRDLQKKPTEDQEASNEQSASAAAKPPADLVPPLDLDGILKTLQSDPSPSKGNGLLGDVSLDGDAFGDSTGQSQSSDSDNPPAVVFGVSGSGNRFVYVFDRSESMNGYGGKPLRAAKTELIRSIRGLNDRQQFQLVFYNDKPTAFRPDGVAFQMITGASPSVVSAERYIRSIAAFGGTKHESAIKLALRLGPDVIFFLTDARIPRLSSKQLREIQIRAQRNATTIHAIEFGSEPVVPTAGFLTELASMNGGQYRYINVQQLSTRPVNLSPDQKTPSD